MQSQSYSRGEQGDAFIKKNIDYPTLLTARGYELATGFVGAFRLQGVGGYYQSVDSELCATRDAAYGRMDEENIKITFHKNQLTWRALKLVGFVVAGAISIFIAWPACLLLPALGGIAWQVGFGIGDQKQKFAARQRLECDSAFVNEFVPYMDSFYDHNSGIDVHKSFDTHIAALGDALSAKLALNSPLAQYLASNVAGGKSLAGSATAINACYSPDLARHLESAWDQQTSTKGSLPAEGLFADRSARQQGIRRLDTPHEQGYQAQNYRIGDSVADL